MPEETPKLEKLTIDQVKLGNIVRDRSTGFTGTVKVKLRHLVGADQVYIEGKYIEAKGFTPHETTDVQILEIVDKGLEDLATVHAFPEEIKLGKVAKDQISGQIGTISVLLEHFNGCHQVQIKPNNLDSQKKLLPAIQLDVKQIVILVDEPAKLPERNMSQPSTGGPADEILLLGDGIEQQM